jgi:hypothetical protein
MNVQDETQCWVILFKDAEHSEYTVHGDVYFSERDARDVATRLAKRYAQEFHKDVDYATVGKEFTATVKPMAVWKVQVKRVILPSGK